MRGVTSDERRVTSSELSPAMGGQESALGTALTPAMERWRRLLGAGYSIRPRLRRGRRGQAYVEWGPALYDPEGVFVRNIRRDTLRKLMGRGIIGEDGVAAAQDEDSGNDAGPGAGGDVDGGSE